MPAHPALLSVVVLASASSALATNSYYRFEGNLADSLGGAPGVAMQAPPFFFSPDVPVPTIPQNALANTASLNLPQGAALSFEQAFQFNTPGDATLEFWVNPSQRVHEQDLFWTTTTPGDTNRFNIFLGDNIADGCTFNIDYREPNSTLHPLFNAQQSGGTFVPFAIPVNAWTFIALTRVANTYSVYFNDSPTPAATVTDTNPNLPTNSLWSLNGRYTTSGDYGWFSGKVDEIRISDSALLPSQFLAVPTPGALALAASGLALGVRRRRRST